MKAPDRIPDGLRGFAYAMLLVHMEELDALIEATGGTDRMLLAHAYMRGLLEDGPDDPTFDEWCRRAMAMQDDVLDEARLMQRDIEAELRRGQLKVVDGGKA